MLVEVWVEGDDGMHSVGATPLDEFLRQNDELDGDEIARALAGPGSEWIGGGGAAPFVMLTRSG